MKILTIILVNILNFFPLSGFSDCPQWLNSLYCTCFSFFYFFFLIAIQFVIFACEMSILPAPLSDLPVCLALASDVPYRGWRFKPFYLFALLVFIFDILKSRAPGWTCSSVWVLEHMVHEIELQAEDRNRCCRVGGRGATKALIRTIEITWIFHLTLTVRRTEWGEQERILRT